MNRDDIGRRIERLRIKMGMSTQELAARVGKSQATISRIENGKQNANIEILSLIAKALRVHPFGLLTDLPLRHSVLLPPAAVRSDGPMRVMALTLEAARLRAKMDLESAARELGMSADELKAIEMGYAMPDEEALEKIGTLYPVDIKLLKEVATMESRCPMLSERMAVMQHLMNSVLRQLSSNMQLVEKSPELKRLRERMESCFNLEDGQAAAERKASYFSIGHLSDKLLAALQDPYFHEKAEEAAAAFVEGKKASVVFSPTEAARRDKKDK